MLSTLTPHRNMRVLRKRPGTGGSPTQRWLAPNWITTEGEDSNPFREGQFRAHNDITIKSVTTRQIPRTRPALSTQSGSGRQPEVRMRASQAPATNEPEIQIR